MFFIYISRLCSSNPGDAHFIGNAWIGAFLVMGRGVCKYLEKCVSGCGFVTLFLMTT